jgi:hypothetical protein
MRSLCLVSALLCMIPVVGHAVLVMAVLVGGCVICLQSSKITRRKPTIFRLRLLIGSRSCRSITLTFRSLHEACHQLGCVNTLAAYFRARFSWRIIKYPREHQSAVHLYSLLEQLRR